MTVPNAKVAALLARAGKRPAEIVAEAQATPVPLSLADQRANVVEWARRDPANIAILVEAIGRDAITRAMKEARSDLGAPMPDRDAVTAAQCSLFDNWPQYATSGKRPNKNHKGNSKGAGMPHYQATFELFTVPEGVEIVRGVNSEFEGVGPLLDHDELTKRIASLRENNGRPWKAKRPEDADGAALEAFGLRLLALSAANPGKLYGPIFSTARGTKYHLGHYVSADAATIGTPAFTVELHREGFAPVVFSRFAATLPNGAKLPGNVVGHSRVSRRADHSAWRTAFL